MGCNMWGQSLIKCSNSHFTNYVFSIVLNFIAFFKIFLYKFGFNILFYIHSKDVYIYVCMLCQLQNALCFLLNFYEINSFKFMLKFRLPRDPHVKLVLLSEMLKFQSTLNSFLFLSNFLLTLLTHYGKIWVVFGEFQIDQFHHCAGSNLYCLIGQHYTN